MNIFIFSLHGYNNNAVVNGCSHSTPSVRVFFNHYRWPLQRTRGGEIGEADQLLCSSKINAISHSLSSCSELLYASVRFITHIV